MATECRRPAKQHNDENTSRKANSETDRERASQLFPCPRWQAFAGLLLWKWRERGFRRPFSQDRQRGRGRRGLTANRRLPSRHRRQHDDHTRQPQRPDGHFTALKRVFQDRNGSIALTVDAEGLTDQELARIQSYAATATSRWDHIIFGHQAVRRVLGIADLWHLPAFVAVPGALFVAVTLVGAALEEAHQADAVGV